ncbi:MAG: ComF family protein [Micrococcales bacterium]
MHEQLIPIERGVIRGFCLFNYDEISAPVMHAFKTKGLFAVGRSLAKHLARLQPRPTAHLLVAAPSSEAATRQRGYVPSQVVANALGQRWLIPVLLAKQSRAVADQAGLTVTDRHRNLAGAITIGRDLAGKKVWLVDDIVTTGSTLLELASACRAAGAEVLGFSALAQTPLKKETISQNGNTIAKKGLT